MIIIHGEEIDSMKQENLLERRNIDELHLVLVSSHRLKNKRSTSSHRLKNLETYYSSSQTHIGAQ
jgi:hypothetical protein